MVIGWELLCPWRTLDGVGGHKGKLELEPSPEAPRGLHQEALTTILLMDTQQSLGKSCSMGTRNCRQPSQWQSKSIMLIRLHMRITALARS